MEEIVRMLKEWDDILILCHASPDGDAVGSACALLRALRQMGKRSAIQCDDPIPSKYDYLFVDLPEPMFKPRENQSDGAFAPKRIVAVDVADLRLLGSLRTLYEGRIDLAIDHHTTHTDFAGLDYVDASCAANTEILYALLRSLNTNIDQYIADAIYTGISTDTGCFRYRNVTGRTHTIAADMIARGARAGDINQKMFETRTRAQITAELTIMNTMEYHLDGRCVLISMTRALMETLGLRDEDTEGFVSKPREVEGVLLSVALKERPEGGFKVSFRSNPPVDASVVARRLGGGGHFGAAGCACRGRLAEVKERVLSVCQAYFAGMEA